MGETNVEQPPTVTQMKIITLQRPLTLFSLLTGCKVPARYRHKAYEIDYATIRTGLEPSFCHLVSVFKDFEDLSNAVRRTEK